MCTMQKSGNKCPPTALTTNMHSNTEHPFRNDLGRTKYISSQQQKATSVAGMLHDEGGICVGS